MNINSITEDLHPAVFVVNNTYHIMMYTNWPMLVWVEIGGKCYYDDSNGVLRSNTCFHRIIVPQNKLDNFQKYTVYKRPVIKRKAYYTEIEGIIKTTYEFRPVIGDHIRAYHISDAHGMIESPVKAAKAYGVIDFLILNGDLSSQSEKDEDFINIYRLTSELTQGNIPVVFARGNHDMRGVYAEKAAEYMPTDNGKSYYTFRLGSIWGIVLDCGEDKADNHEEYGHTICCHAFRERETEFIKSVICNAEIEYLAKGVNKRLVVVHIPFAAGHYEPPFDIESEIYTEWTSMLSQDIHPDVMITGHDHELRIDYPGCEIDQQGIPCPIVVGATLGDENYFAGAGYEFCTEGIVVTFTDSNTMILGQENIE